MASPSDPMPDPLNTAPAGRVAGLTIGTPTGAFTLIETDGVLTGARWGGAVLDEDTPLLTEAARQIEAYFDGRREVFELPLRIEASRVQQRACAAMLAIPMGQTRTYGEIARGLKVSAQATGQLCGNNPIPLIVPCHRVLGARGLGGFSAPDGVETKVWLLRHEKAGGLLI